MYHQYKYHMIFSDLFWLSTNHVSDLAGGGVAEQQEKLKKFLK